MDENPYKLMRDKIKTNLINFLDFHIDQYSQEFNESIIRVALGGMMQEALEENDAWFQSNERRIYFLEDE